MHRERERVNTDSAKKKVKDKKKIIYFPKTEATN